MPTIAVATVLLVTLHLGLGESVSHPGPGYLQATQECLRRKSPQTLLGSLYQMTTHIKKSVPVDDNKYKRLLPKFTKGVKGLTVMKVILDSYLEDVFSKMTPQVTNQEKILDTLSRLKSDVDNCLELSPSPLSSKERKRIKQIRRTFSELGASGIYKAIGEFRMVLSWVDTYIHQKRREGKTQRDHS